MNPLARACSRLFVDTWARVTQAAEAARVARQAEDARAGRASRFDVRPAAALLLATVVLVFQEYYGDQHTFVAWLGESLAGSPWYELGALGWWAGAKLIGYALVPLVAIPTLLGGRLRDFGLGARGLHRHLAVAGALYVAILPVIVAASYTPAFRATYPFYSHAARSWTDLVAWELMYAATFVAVELFFRGFLLFALEPAMGAHAIFVTVVPYCMIHFEKPLAEVLGAIGAGVVLGTLALATRSIWCGVAVHIAVAWTMDLLALAHGVGWPPK
jgi:hypothetical protein